MRRKEIGIKPIAIGFEIGCRNTANLPSPGGFRVRYQCVKCKTELCRNLGTKELHCHHCGTPVDWRVITYINSTLSDNIEKESTENKKALIEQYCALVESLNLKKEFTEPVYMAEFSEKENTRI